MKVQLLRLKGRTSLRVFRGIGGNLKRFYSGVMDGNMIGMTITTYRIMRNNYIRLKITDYFYKTFGNFVYGSRG